MKYALQDEFQNVKSTSLAVDAKEDYVPCMPNYP